MEPLGNRQRIQALSAHREQVVEALNQINFDGGHIRRMIETFEQQIQLANSPDEMQRQQTDLFWENTFVRRLLDGTENGTYLGMDLGGTNFRLVRVDLRDGEATTATRYYSLGKGLLVGPSSEVETLPAGVEVVARISDTTGTLLAGNLLDKNCKIGLILGTGSNAAFVEYTHNIEKWDACYNDEDPSDVVVINCEFGAFGDNGCLDFMKTEFDKELDTHSNHPGSYTFEKHYSGHYLGELVRLALIKLVRAGCLFADQPSALLEERWSFTTAHVTAIESDSQETTTNTMSVLAEFGIPNPTADDVLLVQEVCELMSTRGAYIVATAMVVLLNHINLPEVTIAVDGSLYEHHPKYHNNMVKLISTWCPQTKTTLRLVKDGSGQGGALVAAISEKTLPH
ncbi:hexokinase type 2-like isoform X3 [Dreissena polymorpha]|uniref:hexokinase type 2-like isoform X3 n=1 Tax=Dreissena polymorpha TaxID=45954 RepID=UPI0022640C87|nr:hexokinase type 2-like isoform X3 [Dreissena polymorpha]